MPPTEERDARVPIRVFIADDHPVVRCGLVHTLGAETDLNVVGTAATVDKLVEHFPRLAPDVTVLDLEMGEVHGVDALRILRSLAPTAKVIIYTAYDEQERVAQAASLNFQGYMLKDTGAEGLAEAIRTVHGGGTVLTPTVATKLLIGIQSRQQGVHVDFSERQRQVLTFLTQGRSNRYIADRLRVTERTVKFHVTAVLAKLQVSNRTEAALIATQHGLIERN